jgi:hypothetical protein
VAVQDPSALGMVLAMLVNPAGKPVEGGSGKGQLYVSRDEIVVVRPPRRDEVLHQVALALMLGSVAAVLVNVFTWRSTTVLWVAVAAQAIYWLLLPTRRRAMETKELSAAELDLARRAGRVVVRVPAGDVLRAVPPERSGKGLRRPARFELAQGALEIYLSDEQFRAASTALGR